MNISERINTKKLIRVVILVLADLVLVNLAQFLALFIRFEFSMTALRESGFALDAQGNGLAKTQNPAAGQYAAAGTTVTVRFEEP